MTIIEATELADKLYDYLKDTLGQYFFIDRKTFRLKFIEILLGDK